MEHSANQHKRRHAPCEDLASRVAWRKGSRLVLGPHVDHLSSLLTASSFSTHNLNSEVVPRPVFGAVHR